MHLKTELQHEKLQVLIVDKNTQNIVPRLKSELKKYDNNVFVSPKIPPDLDKFDTCFILNEKRIPDELLYKPHKLIIFLFVNHKKAALKLNSLILNSRSKNIKIISLDDFYEGTAEDIEKILWFSFSRSNETFLNIQSLKIKKKHDDRNLSNKISLTDRLKGNLKPRKLVFLSVLLIVAVHFLFIPPLLLASYLNYISVKAITGAKMEQASSLASYAEKSFLAGKKLYSFTRPTFLVLGIVIFPDNMIQLNEKSNTAIKTTIHLYGEISALTDLLLKTEKSNEDKAFVSFRLNNVKKDLEMVEEDLSVVYQKLPEWTGLLKKTKLQLKEFLVLLSTSQKFIPYAENILAKNSERKYLLLFANNMELRPGGGFIGSFGILTLKDFSIKELRVYDVYDADGQLVAHIEPPQPIRKHLNQPHWFLRDSAFSPDFLENYRQALFFLDKEMGFTEFDGGIMITTTAIQNILSSLGNLYIPDFKEIVNKDNFYLKAQMYAEKGFFPGSLQKKRFLSSVANQMLINIQDASKPVLLKMIRKSLDEKQIVSYFEEPALQKAIDSLYWSGRMIGPECAARSESCVVDYIFPVDANLGVNKANFFVNRSISANINIDADGTINSKLSIKIKNDSPNEAFPGGTYKNYFQVALPKNITLKKITKNDVLIEDYDEIEDQYKTVGFLLEIKPQSSANIEVHYQLQSTISKGQGAYQLIVQKQTGSPNSDMDLTINLPRNIYIVNQNFSPLVKDNSILYNTTLTADKIFFIDLIRE